MAILIKAARLKEVLNQRTTDAQRLQNHSYFLPPQLPPRQADQAGEPIGLLQFQGGCRQGIQAVPSLRADGG